MTVPQRTVQIHAITLLAAATLMMAARPTASRADYDYGDLRTWDLVVIGKNLGPGNTGNYSIGSDVEGRTLIGGSTSGSPGPIAINLQGLSSFNNVDTIVVAGNVTNPIQIKNGNAVVSSTASASNILRAGTGSVVVDTMNLSTLSGRLATELNGVSSNLLALASYGQNVTTPGSPQAVNFTTSAANTRDGIAVFNINGGLLSSSKVQQIDLKNTGNATSIIFNVSGTGVSITNNFLSGFANNASRILFNFYEATTVHDTTALHGALLAPGAALLNTTQLNGPVYVNSFSQSGEVHLPFANFASQSGFGQSTPLYTGYFPAVVPEPSTLALSALGLAGVAIISRRRSRRAG